MRAFASQGKERLGMWMLVSGLALFFIAHLIPTFPDVRTRLVGMIGQGPYAGLFSLVSLVSLVLVVGGYGAMQSLGRANPQLWGRVGRRDFTSSLSQNRA